MFHIADSLSIDGVTQAGGCQFFAPKFEAAASLRAGEADAINFTTLVPTMIKMLTDTPEVAPPRLVALNDLFYGGSIMLAGLTRRAIELLPHLRLHQGYGLTQISPTVTYLSPVQHRDGSRIPDRWA